MSAGLDLGFDAEEWKDASERTRTAPLPAYAECSERECPRPIYADSLCKFHYTVARYRGKKLNKLEPYIPRRSIIQEAAKHPFVMRSLAPPPPPRREPLSDDEIGGLGQVGIRTEDAVTDTLLDLPAHHAAVPAQQQPNRRLGPLPHGEVPVARRQVRIAQEARGMRAFLCSICQCWVPDFRAYRLS